MTTITQTLTVLPTAPARSQVPLTFIANADAFIGALALFQTQQNTLSGQINTVSGEVATNAATTATNTTTVNTAAAAVAAQSPVTNAAAAAASATAAANSATAAATSAGGVNFTLTSVSTLTNKTLTAPVINGFSGTGNGTVTGNLAVTGALSSTGALTTAGLKEDTSGNLGLGVTPSAWDGIFKAIEGGAGSTNGGALYFQNNGDYNTGLLTNAYFSAGNFRYKNAAPSARYAVYQNTHQWFTAPSGTAGNPITFTNTMTLTSAGVLQIGTTSQANGRVNIDAVPTSTAVITQWASSGGTAAYYIVNGANVGAINCTTTTTSYATSSDARLKTNIVDAPDAASLIDSIQVRSFDWKSDDSHQRYGFVAQELYEVAPEAVSKPADHDEMMAVDYSKLVPMLVLEIQSLRQRLATAGI